MWNGKSIPFMQKSDYGRDRFDEETLEYSDGDQQTRRKRRYRVHYRRFYTQNQDALIGLIAAILAFNNITKKTTLIFFYLLYKMEKYNRINVSNSEIAKYFNMSPSHVSDAFRVLKKHSFIKPVGKDGKVTIYEANLEFCYEAGNWDLYRNEEGKLVWESEVQCKLDKEGI